jgi:hypothetical protein
VVAGVEEEPAVLDGTVVVAGEVVVEAFFEELEQAAPPTSTSARSAVGRACRNGRMAVRMGPSYLLGQRRSRMAGGPGALPAGRRCCGPSIAR